MTDQTLISPCKQVTMLDWQYQKFEVLEDRLEIAYIFGCYRVDGIFTHLKELSLNNSAARVDIWDIGENDFSKLEQLDILITLYGGGGVELQLISDGPDLTKTPHLFKNAASNTTERWA